MFPFATAYEPSGSGKYSNPSVPCSIESSLSCLISSFSCSVYSSSCLLPELCSIFVLLFVALSSLSQEAKPNARQASVRKAVTIRMIFLISYLLKNKKSQFANNLTGLKVVCHDFILSFLYDFSKKKLSLLRNSGIKIPSFSFFL